MFGLSALDIAVIAAGAVSLLLWIVLYIIGSKYNSMFEVLPENDFRLKDIYGLGYGTLEILHYKYTSKSDRKLRKHLEILYGEQYADYYLRATRSQQVTLSLTMLVVAFIFYGLTAEIAILGIMLLMAGVVYYYFGTVAEKKITERSELMLNQFSDVVSKLALLTNAGMILREAWQLVASSGEGVIYDEMRTATNDMNNGVSEMDAILDFGARAVVPEVKKFAATLAQGIERGNRELVSMLREQNSEVWNLKQQLVRRAGEKASSKMLIPIVMIFIGILIMVIVPIFTNLGV